MSASGLGAGVGEQDLVVLRGARHALRHHDEVARGDVGALVCSHWWKACWPGVSVPPQTTGQGDVVHRVAVAIDALAVGFQLELSAGRRAGSRGARRSSGPRGRRHRTRCGSRWPTRPAAPARCAPADRERKRRSAACAPASSCSKRCMPTPIASGSPTADQSEKRPADPFGEGKHVALWKAPALGLLGIGGGGDHVLRDRLGAQGPVQPVARRRGVDHRLLGGEGLGGYDHSVGRDRSPPRHRRIRRRRCWRHEAHLGAVAVGAQRFQREPRAQGRAAEAQRQHVAERHAGGALPVPLRTRR